MAICQGIMHCPIFQVRNQRFGQAPRRGMTEAGFNPRPLITPELSAVPFYCLAPPTTEVFPRLYRFVHAEGWWDTERRAQRQGFTHIWALLDTPRAGHDLPLRDAVSGFLVHPTWLIKVCPPLPHPHPQTLEHVSSPQDHLRHILTPCTFCPLLSLRALNCKTGTIQTYFPPTSPPHTHIYTGSILRGQRGAQHREAMPAFSRAAQSYHFSY